MKCRSCEVLSCVDCSKEYWGDEYKQHTKCISEEEKYSGKGFQAKANKGEVKQDKWLSQVERAITKAHDKPHLKSLLQKMLDYPNIPRKKAKFQNFLSNSLRIRDTKLVEQVWDILMSEAPPPAVPLNPTTAQSIESKIELKTETSKRKTSTSEDTETVKKKKKDKVQDVNGKALTNGETEDTAEKFNWEATITKILSKNGNSEIPIKKLRKKFLKKYRAWEQGSTTKSEEKLLKKLDKKIKKIPEIELLDSEKVKLVTVAT
ncbi:unnamed protein product [Owenia fusiformis]|uniref:Zinc finger C2H2 LYAR-type domain-containing protein n=1 Tax=Owenia fusiformis TaxID=6347 RepID=A0A8J1T4F9_OWEFU|nr:unnamed protein product [Owenia fusiformis]